MAKKNTVLTRFVFGEISQHAAQTLNLEASQYGLRKCRNMLVNSLSGVQSRLGSRYIANIDTGRFISYSYNGSEGILLLYNDEVNQKTHLITIAGENIKMIDKTLDDFTVDRTVKYHQWGNYIIILNQHEEPYLIDLEDDTIACKQITQINEDESNPLPLWGDNHPLDVSFHVDRFVFINRSSIFGGNSVNSTLQPYNFKEVFQTQVSYNALGEEVQIDKQYDIESDGSEVELSQQYYSALSSFSAKPIGGADSGFHWIVTGKYLIGGSNHGLWVLSDPEGTLTPDTLYIKKISPMGTSEIPAIPFERGFLYFQADNKTFAYAEYVQGDAIITNLNNSSQHLFEDSRPVKMVMSFAPDNIVWILREDHKIVTYQHNSAAGVTAWALHDLSYNVYDLSVYRENGEDTIVFMCDSEVDGYFAAEIKPGNKFIEAYEGFEKAEEDYNEESSINIPRFANKVVSVLTEESVEKVTQDLKLAYVSEVKENGDFQLPLTLSSTIHCFIGRSEWNEKRIISDEIGYLNDEGYTRYAPGYIELEKSPEFAHNLETVTMPEYAGYYVFMFKEYSESEHNEPFTIPGYEELTADNNGNIVIPRTIQKGYIGLDIDAHIEPRIFPELHKEKKGKIISLAPVVSKTNGFMFKSLRDGDVYQYKTLNNEYGEDFSGQVDRLNISVEPDYFPGFKLRSAKGCNLHIVSIYVEAE